MPVIRFTDADRLASTVMEKGSARAILAALDAQPAKSQNSINYWATFKIVDGPYMGKELKCCFNTKTEIASLLGTMKFFPASDLMKIRAAVDGIPFNKVDWTVELVTEDLLNKPLDLIYDTATVDGDLINVITNFVPPGKATATIPF